MLNGQWCLAGWWGQLPSSPPSSSCTICCTLPLLQDIWQTLTPKEAITLPSKLKDSLVHPFGKTHEDNWIPGELEVMLLCWRTVPVPALRRGRQLSRPAQRKSQLVIQACPWSVVLVLSIFCSKRKMSETNSVLLALRWFASLLPITLCNYSWILILFFYELQLINPLIPLSLTDAIENCLHFCFRWRTTAEISGDLSV